MLIPLLPVLAVLRLRYKTGLKNFFSLYTPIADSWQIYDNSTMGWLDTIASKLDNQMLIYKDIVWQKLVEQYDETTKK